jgi:ribosomal protein S18 acetylase RimI-like enzyme
MNLKIKYATEEDASLIAEISRLTFFETFSPSNLKVNMDIFMNVQFTKGRLMLEVGQPENVFLLAYNDSNVAGYAKLRDTRHPKQLGSSNALEIARLYAMPGMIGKGVGRLLMQEALKIASAKKKEVVWLGVWKQNQKAIDFYTKWGFTIFDQCDFILGNDLQKDWLMKKKVDASAT